MMQSSPTQPKIDRALLEQCIKACFDCRQACTACADADLAEQQRDTLLRCITLDLDCADVCSAAGQMLSRQTEFDMTLARTVLQTCAQVCGICAEECERHQHMEHCRICAQACRRCEQACNQVLSAMR